MIAGMEYMLAHAFQYRFGTHYRIGLATADKGQGTGAGTADAAGHRRVNHIMAALRRRLRQHPRGVRINGGAIDHQ